MRSKEELHDEAERAFDLAWYWRSIQGATDDDPGASARRRIEEEHPEEVARYCNRATSDPFEFAYNGGLLFGRLAAMRWVDRDRRFHDGTEPWDMEGAFDS